LLRLLRIAPLLVALLAAPPLALGAAYEREIDVETETDLQELLAQGEITEDTFDTLLELLRDGVDLNLAGREELYELPNLTYAEVDAILEYRQQAGRIVDPADLVNAGVLTPKQLLQIAPFLEVREPGAPLPVGGRLRLVTRYTAQDPVAPPGLFHTRLKGPHSLTLGGALVTTRQRLGAVTYDTTPNRNALSARPAAYQLNLPKLFVQWKTPQRQVVAGTFRAGFGERLTLDNTSRYTPGGLYPDDLVLTSSDLRVYCRQMNGELDESPCPDEGQRVTPDFTWREGFRGVGGTVEELDLGRTRLSLHGLASYQSRAAYQYTLFEPDLCVDPHDPDCKAPEVFITQDDPLAPTGRFKFSTLPNVFDELLVGGNVTGTVDERVKVGVTGYYAMPFWRVPGLRLDFQEWSRYPYGGPFGAVGVNGSARAGDFRLFMEAARSFDSMPDGGGGYGVIQRSTFSRRKQELELSFRYYDKAFANPYARPISAPDVYDGLRARNEAGARVRYLGKIPDWRFRSSLDVWLSPEDGRVRGTAGRSNLDASARADFVGWDVLQFAGWTRYSNKDLGVGGRRQCYGTEGGLSDTGERNESGDEAPPVNEFNEALPCAGELLRLGAHLRSEPWGRLARFTVAAQNTWLDEGRYTDRFRQDRTASAEVSLRPAELLRVNVRSRYLLRDVEDNTRLEQSWWNYADLTYIASKQLKTRLRYDLYTYLDERPKTPSRVPSPEHRMRFEVEGRF
jgi:hypothetical protein